MSKKAAQIFIIGTFVTLYLLVSVISTIHVIDFFLLSNPKWLAISLAIAFEVGAAASLASIITLEKMNKGIVWGLFILLTAMQAMGNTYYTYVHLTNFKGWIELFGMVDEDLIYQKRILSIVSGAILPIVALGFIKSLVDYLKPEDELEQEVEKEEELEHEVEQINETTTTTTTANLADFNIPINQKEVDILSTSEGVDISGDLNFIESDKPHLGPDEALARGLTLGGNPVVFQDKI